ncbi:MAG TPA: GGDEF domain-containing protein [Acidimicrobiales bacterium]|nr:GGDEF domain-containing protein [Acidimicrobiales bacterium]
MSTSAPGRHDRDARPTADLEARPDDHGQDRRQAVFDALFDAAAIVDELGTITDVNRTWATFATLNGGQPDRTGPGANYLQICEQAGAGGDPDAAAVATGLHGVLGGRLRAFEHRYPCPSPLDDRWFVVRITPLSHRRGALVCHLDVTAAKLAEDRLAHRASHDPLTGLPNRAAVLTHLRAALARLDRRGTPVAVLFLDLDGFKPVNDRYGHAAGDQFLVRIARRLQRQVRATDIVGRVGGDEFLAVCDAADAEGLAERLREAVSAPVQLGGDSLSVGVSIGVAVATEAAAAGTGEQATALLARADQAMYAAKRARRPPGPPAL